MKNEYSKVIGTCTISPNENIAPINYFCSDGAYIFNIPRKHIENLVEKKYPDRDEQRDIIQEECAELIQAVSKYKRWLNHPSLDEQLFVPIREHIVEELTHVAISLGMLQYMLDITQEEINGEVKRKALESYFRLDGYPECFRDDAL